MTEHEANMKFCEFIKSNFGFEPVPVPLCRLNSLYGERAVFFVHDADQARSLGFHFSGTCTESIMIAPYFDYNDLEAFEYFDYDTFGTARDFTRLENEYDDWSNDEESDSLFDDIDYYQEAYYVISDCVTPVGLEELIWNITSK